MGSRASSARHFGQPLTIAIFCIALVGTNVTLAHHSTAEYDSNTVTEARGTVTRVLWRNPHVRIQMSTAAFDRVDLVWELEGMDVTRLDRAGIPRVISRSGGYPIRFFERDGDIVLLNEWFGLERTIAMNPSISFSGDPPRPLGYSSGRWENEALVVTTTRIDWPFFQLYGLEGVPQSQAMTIVERFTPNENGSELVYDLEATDPNTFTRTVAIEGYVTFGKRPGLAFLPYECVLDSEER